MKKTILRFHDGTIYGWKATGEKDASEHRGILIYSQGPDRFAVAQANKTIRLDRVAQGDRSSNPYLGNQSYFGLIYLLVKSRYYTDKSYSNFEDLVGQIRCHPEFQRVIALEKVFRESENRFVKAKVTDEYLRTFSTESLIPIIGLNFDPENDEQLGMLAEKELKRILFQAAEKGSQALELIAKASKAIESKAQVISGEAALFIEALGAITRELQEVPTQRDFREYFIQKRKGRTEEQFKSLRDSLGFKWLPHAKRGRKKGGAK